MQTNLATIFCSKMYTFSHSSNPLFAPLRHDAIYGHVWRHGVYVRECTYECVCMYVCMYVCTYEVYVRCTYCVRTGCTYGVCTECTYKGVRRKDYTMIRPKNLTKTRCCQTTIHTECLNDFRLLPTLISHERAMECGQPTWCSCLWINV